MSDVENDPESPPIPSPPSDDENDEDYKMETDEQEDGKAPEPPQKEPEPVESTEPLNEYDAKLVHDRSNRFNFLLEQTEIFSHFMSETKSKVPTSPLKMKPPAGPKRTRLSSEGGST